MDRRSFLRSLVPIPVHSVNTEQKATTQGTAMFSTNGLITLPDSYLGQMIPVWRSGLSILIDDDSLVVGEGEEKRRIALKVTDVAVLRDFGRDQTLKQIGNRLEESHNLPPETGFEYAKQLFLRLATDGLCHPAAPPPA